MIGSSRSEEGKKLSVFPILPHSAAHTHSFKNKNINFSIAWDEGQVQPNGVIFEKKKDLFYTAVFNCERDKGESAYDTAPLGSGIMIADALMKPQSESNSLKALAYKVAFLTWRELIQVDQPFGRKEEMLNLPLSGAS